MQISAIEMIRLKMSRTRKTVDRTPPQTAKVASQLHPVKYRIPCQKKAIPKLVIIVAGELKHRSLNFTMHFVPNNRSRDRAKALHCHKLHHSWSN